MGLFDGETFTIEALRAAIARGHQGQTIRAPSGGGPSPTMRTKRHRPWWELLGAGPEGATCRACQFLRRQRVSKVFFKCGKQPVTSGPGTDIRMKDPACRLFQIKEA